MILNWDIISSSIFTWKIICPRGGVVLSNIYKEKLEKEKI